MRTLCEDTPLPLFWRTNKEFWGTHSLFVSLPERRNENLKYYFLIWESNLQPVAFTTTRLYPFTTNFILKWICQSLWIISTSLYELTSHWKNIFLLQLHEQKKEIYKILKVCGHEHDALKKVIKCVTSKVSIVLLEFSKWRNLIPC